MSSLIPEIANLRVSSVLNRDTKQFGKQFLIDGSNETCWNSHQGKPQHISVEFKKPVNIKQVHIMFQGGFAGKDCEFIVKQEGNAQETKKDFFPQDANSLQKFDLELQNVVSLIIVFKDSYDFFGRITIYKLDIVE